MAKYSVGQKVKVIDDSEVYDTYYGWATDNKLSFLNCKIRELWAMYLTAEDNDCESGTELTVIATGCHGDDRCLAMYLCEDARGNPVLISEAGLDPVEEGLKWTDLKIGDVIRSKVSGNQYMVTGKDDSENTSHVFVGDYWRTDSELRDYWEKVE